MRSARDGAASASERSGRRASRGVPGCRAAGSGRMPHRPGMPGVAVRGFHGEAIVRSLFQPLRGGGPVETVLPWVHELRRDDDQRVLAPANGVLLHEGHADVGLAGPDAIRADHTPRCRLTMPGARRKPSSRKGARLTARGGGPSSSKTSPKGDDPDDQTGSSGSCSRQTYRRPCPHQLPESRADFLTSAIVNPAVCL